MYVPDLGRHGGEEQAYPSPERMRDGLLAFLDALGLDRVDLAGRAAGGEAAYLVAQAQPRRVARLVLEKVSVIPRRTGKVGPDPVDADRFLFPEGPLPSEPDDPDGFRRITAPTLVLAGGPESRVRPAPLAEMARLIPDARLITIPVGHLVHAAAPQEFVRAVADFLDEPPDSESARLRPAGRGVLRTGEDIWTDGESEEGRLTSNEVAPQWAAAAVGDGSLAMEHRLRFGFGPVDLLDAYGATVEIGSAVGGAEDPGITRVLWNGYRSRLEVSAACEAIVHSLWADWFEDRDTAETVFTEVLGQDITQLRPDAPQPLLRRARRVPESSGPVV
ncbi:alpha/beta fold hydrolase [Streptomyces sp. NPDC057705]|uniref:alpha/beta fold hydrolase n=1 Tax=Streptomyces sp. NPDC057705 TaxID=3346222 RepID=UPI00368607D7